MKTLIFSLLLIPSLCMSTQQLMAKSDGNTATYLRNPDRNSPWPYAHKILGGHQDKTGNIWFTSTDAVYRYNGNTFTTYSSMDGMRADHVSQIIEDVNGALWFGALDGVVRVEPMPAGEPVVKAFKILRGNPAKGIISSLQQTKEPELPLLASVITVRKGGGVWFANGYKLYYTDGAHPAITASGLNEYLKEQKVTLGCGIPEDFGIHALYQDANGDLLFSAVACCCCFNITYRLHADRLDNPCLYNNCGHTLSNKDDMARHNKEIAASLSVISRRGDDKNIAFTTVLKDNKGDLWFGSMDGGAYKYDGRQFILVSADNVLNKSSISDIYIDKDGDVWFASSAYDGMLSSGVFRYRPATQPSGKATVTHYTTKDGLCSGGPFSNNAIKAMMQDNTGKMWFGGDGGICYYDTKEKAGKQFRNFTQKDGLKDDHISFILKDNGGMLWFGTWNMGVYRYNGKTLECFTRSK